MTDPNARIESLPPALYHYTSAIAFLNIVSTASVRASAAGWLNDATELGLAGAVTKRLLMEKAASAAPSDREQWERFANFLDVEKLLRRDPGWMAAATVCVFSMTADSDDLNQWRAYCPLEGGYAIGFRTDRLKEATSSQVLVQFDRDARERESQESCVEARAVTRKPLASYNWELHPCVYEDEDHARVMGRLLRWVEEHDIFHDTGRYENFWTKFLTFAPLLKHRAFRHEKEWRLVSAKVRVDALELRATATNIVPFATIPIRGCFERVIVGPQLDQQLAKRGAEAVMSRQMELVECSTIPYRLIR